jgi:hypothetical protein
MIQSRKTRWAGRVVRVGKQEIDTKFAVNNGRKYNTGRRENIVNMNQRKEIGRVWTGLIFLVMETVWVLLTR